MVGGVVENGNVIDFRLGLQKLLQVGEIPKTQKQNVPLVVASMAIVMAVSIFVRVPSLYLELLETCEFASLGMTAQEGNGRRQLCRFNGIV